MNADDDRTRMERDGEGASDGGRIDARLAELRKQLDEGRQREAERQGRTRSSNAGMAQALKMGSEFVAGVIVGFALGYGIDYALGTSPWGMIIFLLLGFAAGTLNVMRAAGVVAEPQPHHERRRDDDDT